jgi:hypothetical protein
MGWANMKRSAREHGTARLLLERLVRALSPRRRKLEELRARWAQPGTKDDWLASRYFELTRTDSASREVDDRTWNDLEFPRIFATLDTTITRLGSQFLFRQLRTYPADAQATDAAHETFRALRESPVLREQIQLLLTQLQADSCTDIVDSLFGAPLENVKFRHAIVLWSIACIVVLVSLLALSWTWLLVLPLLVVNSALAIFIVPRAFSLVESLKRCALLVAVGDRLARLGSEPGAGAELRELRALAAARHTRARARRTFRWFVLLERLPFGLGTWLNLLCLAELVAYIGTLDRFLAIRSELTAIYEHVAGLDASIAIASLLERTATCCKPLVSGQPVIEIEAARHPLLAHQTANSIALRECSALVSGSNMAGKTTFIKTIGINIILGRTLGVCLASRAIIPRAPVMACIRAEHSIESGKSRYFAEVEALHEFLCSAERGESPVLVIDEPFSGTNTLERIAAAEAVLGALARRSQVLATTHDVELQELLSERFERFHFREDPSVEGFFDYRLQRGTCTEGNALRLLEKMGFPRAIVEQALALVARRLPMS